MGRGGGGGVGHSLAGEYKSRELSREKTQKMPHALVSQHTRNTWSFVTWLMETRALSSFFPFRSIRHLCLAALKSGG